MKTVSAPDDRKCPRCLEPTGHLDTTYSHQTTDGAGKLMMVGRGYCSLDCAAEAGTRWRKLHVPGPVKTAASRTVRDEQHGGKLVRMGKT